jgi:hypothetical protein
VDLFFHITQKLNLSSSTFTSVQGSGDHEHVIITLSKVEPVTYSFVRAPPLGINAQRSTTQTQLQQTKMLERPLCCSLLLVASAAQHQRIVARLLTATCSIPVSVSIEQRWRLANDSAKLTKRCFVIIY